LSKWGATSIGEELDDEEDELELELDEELEELDPGET